MVAYKDKPIKKCPKCGQIRRIINKGLCGFCYQKFERPKIKCKICGHIEPHQSKGLCNTCYKREGTPKVICKKCKKLKPHKAKGMCSYCFLKTYHYDSVKRGNYKKYHNISLEEYRKLTKSCVVCGFDKIVDLHHLDYNRKNNSLSNFVGLCPNHHKMLHNELYSKEIEEILIKKELINNRCM